MNRVLPLASLRAVSRIPSFETTTKFPMGDEYVSLTIGYSHSYSEPGSIDVLTLQWNDGQGHEADIEHGQLFEFIANQSCVIEACVEDAEANS
jgi:hypothetical protein